MERFAPRDSTAVEYVGYDRRSRELHVTYAGGREYLYRRVPPLVFHQLKAVDAAGGSIGQFVNWRVKPVYLDYSEVDEGPRPDQSRSPVGPARPDRRTHRQRQERPGAPPR